MKLLFEVWGNYKNWQKVTYVYDDKEIESNTTLPLLLDNINPEKCFIILSDTLIENICNDKVLSYNEYLIEIKNDVNDFIKNSYVSNENNEKCEILILPGVGTFNKTKFIGNPLNFYSVLYYELIKKFINEIIPNINDSKIEIYLDITHGINYMTMMTYRVIREISQMIAFFYNVKLIVLNSDPKVGSENENLMINKIENTNVIPKLEFYSYSENKILKVSKYIPDKEKEELGKNSPKINKEILDKIFAFVGSFIEALPLFIYYFYLDDKSYESIIAEVFNFFYKNLKIEKKDKITFTHCVDFSGIFISILQYKLLKTLLNKQFNLENKKEIKFNEFMEFKNVFEFSRTLKQRLENELDKIYKIENKLDYNYKDYGYYLMENNYIEDDNFTERNFYAHCGFGYNIIQLKKEGEDIFIRMKPNQKLLEKIIENIIKNIPKGE